MKHQSRLSMSSMSPHRSHPMADSTRIDGTPVSPRNSVANLMHRTLSLERSQSTTNGSLGIRNASSPSTISRQKLNLSQLDPKTFVDVHSSGLASRIVAYHHDSTVGARRGLQRSMSVSNLYNPLKQPRRTPSSPLPYRPSPPTLSMTQIAPPERSFYCGNTLPGLLLSNSVVGVHKANNEHEQLSRENRPIMHPHPPQHESEPTRSVLEELKEISRKRINSGETQKQHEFLKRSCQRIGDFVDHHPAPSPATTFKRQRELSVAVPLRHHHAATTTVPQLAPTQIQMQTQHHLPITEAISPEQLAKRRNCSYSNDIASSLSSSRRHVSKRKLYDMRESMRQSSMEGTANGSSPEISPSAHVAKMQRKIEAESVSKTQSVPIASVPVVAPQRTISAPTLGQQQQQAAVELPLPVSSKPKLTLFNAKQTQEQLQKQPTKHYDLDSPDVDAGEYAGIQFVKPKQQNSMGGVKNPSVERTHKTKLAIMLSGLRGEIYQGDEPDELDAPVSPKTPIKQPIVALTSKAATATLATTTSISTITKTPTTSSSDKPIILTEKVIATAPTAGPATATAPTTTTPMTNGLQPKLLFGQAPTPAATVPKQTPVTTASSSPAATTASSSPAATTVLTFGSPKSTATTTATATSSAPAPVLSFGKAPTVGTATPFKLDSNPNSLSKMNGLPSIGGIAAITSVPAPAATATPPAMSFGSSSTTTAAGTASFMFGKSEESSGAAAAAKPPVFSFGAGTTATATAAPSFFGNPPQSNGFGSAFKQPEAIKASTTVEPEPAKPSTIIGIKSNFGSNSFGSAFKQPAATTTTTTAVTAAAQPSNAFSFSGTTNTSVAPAPAPAANLFAFGGAAAAKPAEPAAAPAPSNSTNIFGQSAAATTPATFSFGGAAAAAAATAPNTIKETNKPSFAFGGDPSATTAAQSNGSNTNTNNLFNFGAGGTSGTPSFGSAASTNAPSSSAFSFSAAQKPIGSQIDNNNTAPGAATATKPFAFGGGQQQVNGAATAPSGGFSFAAAAKKNEATAIGGASMFGTPNNASTGAKPSFSLGGSSSSTQNGAAAPATGQQSAPAPGQPGAFSFAAVAKKETSGASMFGQPSSATPSASIKPSFSFGGSSSNSTQNPAATAPAPAPSFGGFGAAPAPAGNQSKPFAFGGTTAAAPSASPAMGGNLFANAVSAVQNQPKPGGFSFGGTASKTNTHQAAAPPPGNAPFSFGGATAAGGMASPPSSQNVNTTKPFSFGSAASAFGSPSPSPVQAAPAANFGTPSASVAPGMSQQINAGNLFALPPEQRPIRRATRRLQK